MNTEKTKNPLTDAGSLEGDCFERRQSVAFLCVHRVSVVLSVHGLAHRHHTNPGSRPPWAACFEVLLLPNSPVLSPMRSSIST